MNIVIVGNSDGVIGSGLGNKVNSADMVVRINCVNLSYKNYIDVGSKTTHLFIPADPEKLEEWAITSDYPMNISSNNSKSVFTNTFLSNRGNIITRGNPNKLSRFGYLENEFNYINSINTENTLQKSSNILLTDTFISNYFEPRSDRKIGIPSDLLRSEIKNKWNSSWGGDSSIFLSSGILMIIVILSLYKTSNVNIHGISDSHNSHFFDDTFIVNGNDHSQELELDLINQFISNGFIKRLEL